ncbi:transposase [Streptomyces sp. NPDC097727]|uniref:transposase n=1 Tax=Streptomyces sp. NPDC097727 TaxID=3366092 RepID=UPI00382724DE
MTDSIALDVTPWPRPDAECSPGRLHCYRPCRCDGKRQTIPGWPYQVAAALGGGRSSWTGPLDAIRLNPEDDLNTVTVTQIRGLLARLEQAGQRRDGDPPVLFVLDSGYDIVRLTWLLRKEPVRLLGRIRSGRTFYHPPGKRRGDHPGRPPRHGEAFRLADPATHGLLRDRSRNRSVGVPWRGSAVVVTPDEARTGGVPGGQCGQ